MSIATRVALALGQLLGTAAALSGLLGLLGLWWTLLVAGVVLLATTTAMEARLLGRPSGRSAARSGPRGSGVE